MKIIRNNIIPFKGFKCINLFEILFVRKSAFITDVDINHEMIHTKLMRELLWIGFYLWYIIEWLIRVLFVDTNYKNISFEVEAYEHLKDLNYLKSRKHYTWLKYL